MKTIIMQRFSIVATLLFAVSFICSAEAAITEANWVNHPAIQEVRAVFTKIEKDLETGKVKPTIREKENERGLTSKLSAWKDNSGAVTKFSLETGTEDSAYTLDHYYVKGILRFVFVKAGTVNGTHMEYRIYFNAKGERIWENRKQTAGPGYPFAETIDEEILVRNPAKAMTE